MKFHKAKCKVLPWLGWKNPLPRHRLRAARLQCSSARKAWGSGAAASWADPTACPGNRDRQQCPQLCKYTGGRSREGIIPQHSSGVLHPVWGFPVEQRHWQTGVSSAEGHQDDQGWKTCPVRRGWGTRACSACRRQLWGEPNSYPPVLTGMEMEKGSAVHSMVRDSRQKSKQERLGLDIRRNNFPIKTSRQWCGLLREAVKAPSLEVFSTNWIKHWAGWSDLTADTAWAGGWTRDLQQLLPTWITL